MREPLIIIAVVLMFGFASGCTRQLDGSQLQDRNGLFYAVNEDNPYSGKVTWRDEAGHKLREMRLSGGSKVGQEVYWHLNGQKFQETDYNIRSGWPYRYETRWRSNGVVETVSIFDTNGFVTERRFFESAGRRDFDIFYSGGQETERYTWKKVETVPRSENERFIERNKRAK